MAVDIAGGVVQENNMINEDKNNCKQKTLAELQTFSEFYEYLSDSVYWQLTKGTYKHLNYRAYIYSSMGNSLLSISDILTKNKFNDAYQLFRGYYDTVILDIYSALYIEKNMKAEKMVIEEIDNWVQGKTKLPSIKNMIEYIQKEQSLKHINETLLKDGRYKHIRTRCDDHIHYNFYQYLLMNISQMQLEIPSKYYEELLNEIDDIFILHFAYTFTINPLYMMSSDYIDSLDMGIQPEEGTQYLVAPFIQEVFDQVVKSKRHDVARVILETTCMKLE